MSKLLFLIFNTEIMMENSMENLWDGQWEEVHFGGYYSEHCKLQLIVQTKNIHKYFDILFYIRAVIIIYTEGRGWRGHIPPILEYAQNNPPSILLRNINAFFSLYATTGNHTPPSKIIIIKCNHNHK